MKIFLTLVALSTASASIIGLGPLGLISPAAPGVVVQGPSAQAALAGPDGSAIAAAAQGGTVATGPTAGGILTAGLLAPGLLAAPALAAPTVVAGPSGTVSYA
ncbi:hypothetical protein NQ314_016888 [Rhamnusium bicolor]|uniref:Uncharacterized protein n=1 Tax=Rhamnusium bicolor TaxID=1586634 RepID=A0AAV8WUM3_9CUCU|nr:hypothetical protein NQ314_016888 [Rhamnusium bicolor]